MNYIQNNQANLIFTAGMGQQSNALTCQQIFNAIQGFNQTIYLIRQNIPVDIFSILGMRNLSAFVGEVFARNLANTSNGLFINNPHQDGYPDLLLLDNAGLQIYQDIMQQNQGRNKAPFSPFANGGIEIKATCGDTLSPEECIAIGYYKPDIGDQRIHLLKSYVWKAHHRDTNNLLGLLWDFINGAPTIVAVFFGNNLTTNDWGNIIQPTEGGGRTTSVSIMPRHGVYKMYQNWVFVIDDERYISFLNRHNRDTRIYR